MEDAAHTEFTRAAREKHLVHTITQDALVFRRQRRKHDFFLTNWRPITIDLAASPRAGELPMVEQKSPASCLRRTGSLYADLTCICDMTHRCSP
jgi:hypothetical protein